MLSWRAGHCLLYFCCRKLSATPTTETHALPKSPTRRYRCAQVCAPVFTHLTLSVPTTETHADQRRPTPTAADQRPMQYPCKLFNAGHSPLGRRKAIAFLCFKCGFSCNAAAVVKGTVSTQFACEGVPTQANWPLTTQEVTPNRAPSQTAQEARRAHGPPLQYLNPFLGQTRFKPEIRCQ